MESISLVVPKEIVFDNSPPPVRTLTLHNTCLQKLAFKIRTNHKTALSINVTHDFLAPMSKRDIPIKLIEVHEGVKLEINYTRATEEMLLKNDAKMAGVDKQHIRKCIIHINVDPIIEAKAQSLNATTFELGTESVLSDSSPTKPPSKVWKEDVFNTSVYRPKVSKSEIYHSEDLHVVKQHPEEDEEEFEEKKRELETALSTLRAALDQQKRQLGAREAELRAAQQKAQAPPLLGVEALLLLLFGAYLIGGLLKVILY